MRVLLHYSAIFFHTTIHYLVSSAVSYSHTIYLFLIIFSLIVYGFVKKEDSTCFYVSYQQGNYRAAMLFLKHYFALRIFRRNVILMSHFFVGVVKYYCYNGEICDWEIV